nr:hypothetical protein [Tanacetum cinerariifolium]
MLHVLRVEMVINSLWMFSKNWLVQKQTNFGKDISNPFMADNLPKIVWFSTHHITCMKKLASPKQTALGVNTPRSDEDRLKLMKLMVFLLQWNVCVDIRINVARLSKLLEIVKLKSRVKKLEKINKVKSFKLRWLKKVGTSQRVESLDDMENVFNQERIIFDMEDEGIELVADQEKDAEFEGRHADKHA